LPTVQKFTLRTFSCFIVLCFNFLFVQAQRVHIGVAGGLANYSGDLMDKLYHKKMTNGFIGLTVHYELLDNILIRGAYNFARVNGSDIYSEKENLRSRHLSFESAISEFSVVGEYHIFNLYERRFSPYGFVGLGLYHFDPYTLDSTGRKFFLKPLGTEGQGIYPDKKPYGLWQMAIPFGGGVKFAVSENIRIGIEIGMRKLFTDYLDDVSTSYPGYNDLLSANGQTAVDFSYRGDEVPGGDPTFPTKDTQRGGAEQKDVYYFTGLSITFRPSFGSGGGGNGRGFGKKSKFGCPANPL
jgi:opacity protein-like surface antigen